jgi:hypothetical protein
VPTAAGKVTGSTTPFFGALNATFTLPSTAVAGDSFQADIACTDGLTATEVVNVTSPAFYPYPTTTALEDGNCVDIPLVWSEDLFDCSGVTYQLTNTTLPAGVTADIVASGIEIGGGFAQETLAVCGNVPLTEMLSFKFQVTSNGCFGGPYEANGTVNLVPPPPCVPSTTCPANSCEGSVPNGCGGTISCPTTCASPLVCSSGKCVSPTPTCPSGEDYCTETAECMTPAACARAGGGSSSGGCKGTSCM